MSDGYRLRSEVRQTIIFDDEQTISGSNSFPIDGTYTKSSILSGYDLGGDYVEDITSGLYAFNSELGTVLGEAVPNVISDITSMGDTRVVFRVWAKILEGDSNTDLQFSIDDGVTYPIKIIGNGNLFSVGIPDTQAQYCRFKSDNGATFRVLAVARS